MLIYIWIINAISFAKGNLLKFKFYNNLNVEFSVTIPKNNFFEEKCTLSLESNKNLLHLYDNTFTNNTTEIIIDNKNINIDYSTSTLCLLSFSPNSTYRTVVNELYNMHIIDNKILSIIKEEGCFGFLRILKVVADILFDSARKVLKKIHIIELTDDYFL